jgi:hypothetical protein
LDIYKKAFKEIQTKYNNLIQENNNNLKKIITLNASINSKSDASKSDASKSDTAINSDTLSNIQSELYKCKQEKLQKEKELNDHLTMSQSISLPRSVTDTFDTNAKNEEKIIKELTEQQCNGNLTNGLGVKYILKWNKNVKKCIQEEIKCNDNEIYSENKNKCLPCEDYNLIYDPITKQCIKQSIEQSISILVDENDNIIGESSKDNENDNWTEVRRRKK